MMTTQANNEIKLLFIIAIFYTVGIVLHSIPFFLPLTQYITDIFILLSSGTYLYLLLYFNKNIKILIWVVTTALLTFIIEIIGVKSGIIFGNYAYGDTLKIQFFDVPIVIGLNWAILITGSHALARSLFNKKVYIIVFSGLILVMFDVVLEPVAINLDYWSWMDGTVPFRNYLTWFIISCLSTIFLLNIKYNYRFSIAYFVIQFFYFLSLLIVSFLS